MSVVNANDVQSGPDMTEILSRIGIHKPFVGLRPFEREESLLFFGRNEQIDELLLKLHTNRFLAVVGSSGCGKSSLIRAGLIPKLEAGFLTQEREKWQVAITRPGDDPLYFLARSIVEESGDFYESPGSTADLAVSPGHDQASWRPDGPRAVQNPPGGAVNPVSTASVAGARPDEPADATTGAGAGPAPDQAAQLLKGLIVTKGVQAVLQRFQGWSEGRTDTNFLLLVDQFEELFRFDNKDYVRKNLESLNRFNAHNLSAEQIQDQRILFINVLLALAEQTQLPVYIVITMRSDYLGSCSQFHGLPEILNRSQYLVPRLTRQQRQEAIEGPIGLFQARISTGLLNRLLNDSDVGMDELPVLQHALMRTWNHWLAKPDRKQPLDLSHYEAIGGIEGALNQHARDIFDKLDDKQQKICERVFKSLTDVNEEGRAIRRPQQLGALAAVCQPAHATEAEAEQVFGDITQVVNRFRDRECAFLMPYQGDVSRDRVIDISHESIMRQWNLLAGWMKEEQASADTLYWLSDLVENRRQPLQAADLKVVRRWQKNQQPTPVWASRYADNYEAVQEYIKRSDRGLTYRKIMYALVILGFVATGIVSFLLWQTATQSRLLAAESNLLATQSVAAAAKQKARADSINNARLTDSVAFLQRELRAQEEAKQASIQGRIAEARRREAEKSAAAIQNLYRKLVKETQQKESIARESLRRQQLNTLYQSDFYTTSQLDTLTKSKAVDYLLQLLGQNDSTGYVKAREAISAAVKAKEMLNSEPVQAFHTLKNAWQTDKNPIVEMIAARVLDANLFPVQQTRVPVGAGPQGGASNVITTGFILSGDRSMFAVSISERTYLGHYQGDSLYIDRQAYKFEINQQKSPQASPAQIIFNAPADSLIRAPIAAIRLDNNEVYKMGTEDSVKIGELPRGFYSYYVPSEDGRLLFTVPGYQNAIASVWELPRGASRLKSLISISDDTDREFGRAKNISDIDFSPDNQYVLIGFDDGTVVLGNTRKGTHSFLTLPGAKASNPWQSALKGPGLNTRIPSINSAIVSVSFTPDGKKFVTGSADGNIVVWTNNGAPEGRKITLPHLNRDDENDTYQTKKDGYRVCNFVEISPDGRYIIVKIADGSLLLYDTNNPTGSPREFAGTAASVASFLDTSSVMTLESDGTVQLWKIYPEAAGVSQSFATRKVAPIQEK